MKLGFSIGNFSYPVPTSELGATVSRIVSMADEAGIDSFWTMDHFFQIAATGEPPEAPLPEAYATLAFVAGQTTRIRLGTLVTCAVYREPGALIKALTSLDVLSGGRTILGIGAGWNDVEARGLGLPFPPLAERFERLEELLQIAHQMWRGDESPFNGTHYQLERPLNSPNSLQRPHPPILIGGGGEKKTLRLVAKYGDMCNLSDIPGVAPLEAITHKLEVLRAHCLEVGRDYDEISKTTITFVDLGDDVKAGQKQFLEHLRELRAIGIDQAILVRAGLWDETTLGAIAELVPAADAI